MGYTALVKMQEKNRANYNISDRPYIPEIVEKRKNTLRWCALTFLRENCEDLRFDPTAGGVAKTKEDRNNVISVKDNIGKSYCENQIPYHMQMDIDRLCLERSLGDFLDEKNGGATQQAYLVFYCYLEMYWGKDSAKPHEMIKLLSAFEQNASPLLHKHRDHFVHSVYVFAMGLAIYQQSESFRGEYRKRYNSELSEALEQALKREQKQAQDLEPDELEKKREHIAAYHFLKYWGFTALLHDLGYPFELAYCQINDYYKKQSIPPFYISYQKERKEDPADSLEAKYIPLYKALYSEMTSAKSRRHITVNDVFSKALTQRLYDMFHECPHYWEYLEKKNCKDSREQFDSYLKACLDGKLSDQDYMDHAYFSAYLLLHQLWSPGQKKLPSDYMDALTAILLHNSLFKHYILKGVQKRSKYPKMSISVHPLAYLLMFCDELQCWNRTGYGKETRRENHPIDSKLKFKGDLVEAGFLFDKDYQRDVKSRKTGTYKKFCGSHDPFPFAEELDAFLAIDHADRKDALELKMEAPKFVSRTQRGEPLSHSSFLDLYHVATILNAEYRTRDGIYTDYHETDTRNDDTFSERTLMKYFEQLSLEYKLSNLYQVQCYVKNLEEKKMFFTDRQVAYQEAEDFDDNMLKELGEKKHLAWSMEKKAMGWRRGEDYRKQNLPESEVNKLRERLREHEYIDHPFGTLSEDEQEKDKAPIRQQRNIMKTRFGIRVYVLPGTISPAAFREEDPPEAELGDEELPPAPDEE